MARIRNKCKGQVIPLVAVLLFGFLILAALAIDMGVLYTARTSGQQAADAAALAGAYTFLNPAAAQPAAAQQAAIAVGGTNSILRTPVTIAAGNVVVDVPNRRVTVTVSRTGAAGIPTYFAKIAGKSRVDMVTTATAEASATGSGSRCVKPIFLPNTILSALAPPAACTAGQVVFDSSGHLTAYAIGQMGTRHGIRPTSPTGALAPGQFYSLDFGAGGKDYRCALGNCLNDCPGVDPDVIRCGDRYPLKTGDMVGPTNQGVRDLVGQPPDYTWVAVGQYKDRSGQIWDSSPSLVIAPVWDSCNPDEVIRSGTAGQTVKVIGFLTVFVDGMQGSNVQANIAGATECAAAGGGGGGAGPFGENTGPLGRPVRLVNP